MKTLFNTPLAHTKDPVTSHAAADRLVESGELNRQEQEVLNDISRYIYDANHKDFTPKELAIWLTGSYSENYFKIQRRLSGLRNKGKIKRVQYREPTSPNTFVFRNSKRDGCCVWRLK